MSQKPHLNLNTLRKNLTSSAIDIVLDFEVKKKVVNPSCCFKAKTIRLIIFIAVQSPNDFEIGAEQRLHM